MAYFNKLDVCYAWYLWLSENHGGQWSEEYIRLCKLSSYFTPGPLFKYETMSENAKEIYDDLCNKHGQENTYTVLDEEQLDDLRYLFANYIIENSSQEEVKQMLFDYLMENYATKNHTELKNLICNTYNQEVCDDLIAKIDNL